MNLAWEYGLLPPLDWGPDCEREMALQIDLWNALVAVDAAARAGQRAALVAGDPELAARWDGFDAVCAQIEALPRRPPPETEDPAGWRAAAVALRALRHELWLGLKPRLAAARIDKRDALKAVADRRYAAVTAARQASGLWWGNYNAVCAAFDVALGRLDPGARLRPHEWRGEGRLTNQLQKGAPAAALLQACPRRGTGGGHPQLRIEPLPDSPLASASGRPLRAQGGRVRLLRATVYSGRAPTQSDGGRRRMAVWPIVMHRPFPPGAVVKAVSIHRRRVGAPLLPAEGRKGNPADWRWSAVFSLALPDLEPASAAAAAVGVDFGWRQVDGGLRVATIAGSDGALDHVILPTAWLDRRLALAATYGLAAKLRDSAAPDDRRHYAEYRHAVSHGLDRRQRGRRELYRIAAKALAERYQTIALDKTNVARLGRRKRAWEPEPDMPPQTRRMRTWSAPAELIAEIERAARARGRTVLLAGGQTTVTCHLCGGVNHPPTAQRLDLIWRCQKCGELWDQDENAARVLLAEALRAVPREDGGISLAPRQNKGLTRARMTRKRSPRKPDDKAAETTANP